MKGRKKLILLAMTMILVMVCLAGCGGGDADTDAGDGVAGHWTLQEMQMGEHTYDMKTLADMVGSDVNHESVEVFLVVKEDGTFSILEELDQEYEEHGTWTQEEEGWMFHIDGQDSVKGTMEESTLVLHDTDSTVESRMVFVKDKE